MATAPASGSFEQAKSILLKSDQFGRNLFDHLADVISRVIEEQPGDVLERFEQLSMQVKEDTFVPAGVKRQIKPSDFEAAESKARTEALQLFKPPPPPTDEDGQPIEVPINEFTMPNLMEHLFYTEQCGVGLPREEAFRVQLALRRLGERQPVKFVRFWGKILGTQRDYYIAEAEFKEGEHPDEKAAEAAGDDAGDGGAEKPKSTEVPPEKREGTNKFSYFVCSFPGEAGGQWTLLPDVTPAQINAARKIKKYLTGHLDAAVVSYPPFPGKEREYLRAQIARINATAAVSPKGLVALPDEDQEGDEPAEPFTVKPKYEGLEAEELANIESWVHHAPAVLQQQGRAVFWKAPKEESEGDEEPADETVEEGPALGSSVAQDEQIGTVPAWTLLTFNKYSPMFPVVCVRSNRWPGAVSVAAEGGRRWTWMYIGYGHKYTGSPYSPPLPAPVPPSAPATAAAELADPSAADERHFDELDAQAAAAAQAKADAGDDGDGGDGDDA